MPTTPTEPLLGRIRHVVSLPAGAGRVLSFEGDGVELGNGWFDLSARLATADDGWLPPVAWSPVMSAAALYPRRGMRGRPCRCFPTDMLCDGGRDPFRPLRAGTIMRDSSTVNDAIPAYWLYAGGMWCAAEAVELHAHSVENSGPAGTAFAQVDLDRTADNTRAAAATDDHERTDRDAA